MVHMERTSGPKQSATPVLSIWELPHLALLDDPLDLVQHCRTDEDLAGDHVVALVVGVVSVPKLRVDGGQRARRASDHLKALSNAMHPTATYPAIWAKLKLNELVAPLSVVALVISEIKLVRVAHHC